MTEPFVIAHRGYKAKYAENTLAAFDGAVEVGVDIIETDVHVTSDGVVVINHDPFTGRNYNKNLIIAKTELADLQKLINKTDAEQKILTFEELLQWLVGQRKPIQLMLDIKITNNPMVLAKMIRSLLNVHNDLSFWYDKIIFGLWSLSFYKFAVEANLLANFRIINITLSPTIAKQCVDYSSTLPKKFQIHGISLFHLPLIAPEFKEIYEKSIKSQNIKLYVWTANSVEHFQQALDWGAYGVITDYPDDAIAYFRKLNPSQDTETTEIGQHYQQPSVFTIKGLELNLKFLLFRILEFLLLNGILIHRPVQLLVFKFITRLIIPN